MQEFNYQEALMLNKARIEHLNTLNLDFKNKKILETGCGGQGDITKFLLEKGSYVTLNDYRENNIKSLLNILNINLPYNCWDLNEIPETDEMFDIIVCYGTLYHLSKPKYAISKMSKLCKEFIIISTVTSGKNDEELNLLYEGTTPQQSHNGTGCRPGRLLFFNSLKENFKYVYMLKTQPNDSEYPLVFPSYEGNSRNIFIGSHIKIENELFLEDFVNNYTIKY
jgi:hypothetical protein